MIIERWYHAMAHVEGNVYVFGGSDEKDNHFTDWEVYSIKENVWKSIAPLPSSMFRGTATVYRNEIWIAGNDMNIIAYDYRTNIHRDT